ncbi:MAG: NAD(P)H-dependent oxidoreductase subunit E [Lysobacterales bacterium]
MSAATPWSTELAETLISAEQASARAFYGDDGAGATALLPILHAFARRFGFVPDEALPMIAQRLNISKAEVRGALSFYHDFDDVPPGLHVLKLCRAEACQALGCEQTAAHLAEQHQLKPDSTVGAVTLRNVYCLGNCALGPAALLGEELLARFDAQAADALMARLGKPA